MIRSFRASDADAILSLYRSVGLWFEDVGVNRDFILASSRRPDFRFMVAEEGGEVVGFAGALFFTAVARAELGPVGVGERRRRSGVGSALTEAMLDFLRGEGIRRVVVKVKAGNTKAVRFFMGQGFAHDAYLRKYTLKGEDVVQLVRYL